MRALTYELMKGDKVMKVTSNYNEVVKWDKGEGHWNRVVLEDVNDISKEAEKAKEKHRKKVAAAAGWKD